MPQLREGAEQVDGVDQAAHDGPGSEADHDDDNYDEFGNKLSGAGADRMDVDDDDEVA